MKTGDLVRITHFNPPEVIRVLPTIARCVDGELEYVDLNPAHVAGTMHEDWVLDADQGDKWQVVQVEDLSDEECVEFMRWELSNGSR